MSANQYWKVNQADPVVRRPLRSEAQNNVRLFRRFQAPGETKSCGGKFVSSSSTQLVLLVTTLYSLTCEDYRIMISPKALDPVWDIFIFVCLAIFLAEIILSCMSIKGFFNSYFFYLDLLSCLSMIMDFTPIKLTLVEISQVQGTSVDQISKFIRLVRLFRLVRISKIYKSLGQERKAKGAVRKESKVGKELGNKVTKSVIIICFVLLIFLPIFNPEFWLPNYFGIQGLCFAFTSSMSYGFLDASNVQKFRFDSTLSSADGKNTLEYTLNSLTQGFMADLRLYN